jgi:uncharacterized YigZ family protein
LDTFKTIAKTATGAISEQRSKFIAYASPVATPEEAKVYVEAYRKQYYDARHVCWAYMLGCERNEFRVNDDGEPSSTAGKPILGVILSHELTNILIVVVRYFGGIKLGTSGLIAAYRAAAIAAINNAEIIEKTLEETLSIAFDYAVLNKIMRIVKEENLPITSRCIDTRCSLTLSVRKHDAEKLKTALMGIETLQLL